MFRAQVVLAVALCTIAIHWGFSEFLSVQFGAFIILLMISAPRLLALTPQMLVPAGACVAAILICIPLASHDSQTVLKGCRTVLVIGILFSLSRAQISDSLRESVARGFAWALVASGCLAAVQFLDSAFWNFGIFDVPEELFALDYGTLFTKRRDVLSAAGYFVRPSAFYSEPSALAGLGLIGMSIFGREKRLLFAASFGTVLLSLSLLGVLIAFGLLMKSLFVARAKVLIVAISFLGVLVAAYTLSSRLDEVLSGRDLSAQVRVFLPLQAIGSQFYDGHLFGMSDALARALVPSDMATIFDNWLLNQIIFYGVLGPLFVALSFILLPRDAWLLLFGFMLLNGDAFYYDRLWLISIYLLGRKIGYQKKAFAGNGNPE